MDSSRLCRLLINPYMYIYVCSGDHSRIVEFTFIYPTPTPAESKSRVDAWMPPMYINL